MDTERELITRYKSVEKDIEDLSLEKSSSTEPNEIEALGLRLAELNVEKANIELALSASRDTSTTKRKHASLIDELKEIINHLRINNAGHRISRSQGLNVDNFIFGNVIWDIAWTFDSEFDTEHSVPNYYFEIGGDFDHEPLKRLLESKLVELEGFDSDNLKYLQLKNWVTDLKEQINALWQNENFNVKNAVRH